MELSHPSLAYLAAWLATLTILLLSLHLRRRKLNLPPGPKPWPIIGNLNLVGPLPHLSIHSLSEKYGPIMQLKFGSFPIVVGSSAEMAKAFLKTYDAEFAGRPDLAVGRYLAFNNSDITCSQYGPYWRQARKICSMELFSAKRLDSYEYIRVEEKKLFLKSLYESSGKPIWLKDHLTDMSLNVISRMVLGKKYTNDVLTRHEFKEMLQEVFFFGGALDIGDSIPWLGFLDLQGYRNRCAASSG